MGKGNRKRTSARNAAFESPNLPAFNRQTHHSCQISGQCFTLFLTIDKIILRVHVCQWNWLKNRQILDCHSQAIFWQIKTVSKLLLTTYFHLIIHCSVHARVVYLKKGNLAKLPFHCAHELGSQ